MNRNAYAVFIGVNVCLDPDIPRLAFAEKDCRDLQNMLTHPRTGNFPLENTTLLVGPDATTKTVKRILQRDVVGRSPKDTVLVFFSGHGVVRGSSERRRTYLGTSDLSLKEIALYPHEGLDMDFLHNEIFLATPAHVLVFVLDCCHSGAIVPSELREGTLRLKRGAAIQPMIESLSNSLSAMGRGRVAIVACPADSPSRESARLKNGVFTHFLLEGLRGAAADGDSGEVTVDSLLTYLRSHAPPDQPPGRYGQDYGRIVLTYSMPKHRNQSGIVIPRVRLSSSRVAGVSRPLTHPLEAHQNLITKVIGHLAESPTHRAADRDRAWLLESIRRATAADLAFLMRREGEDLILGARAPHARPAADFEKIISVISPEMLARCTTRRASHGISVTYRLGNRSERSLIIVPTSFEHQADLLVLTGLGDSLGDAEDSFGTVLSATISAHRKVLGHSSEAIESAILDDLKRSYGFIPTSMYRRRQDLFRTRLAATTVYFQPVVYIHQHNIGIDSWEALARNREDGSSPTDLFVAAELWGQQFMGELDRHYLREGTEIFRTAHQVSPAVSAPELSVNVYPQSLMDTEYYNAMREIIDGGVVDPERLVLEISEKVSLSDLSSNGSEEADLTTFRNRLERFVSDFQIGFAIDDFGVRQASVSNLARLHPDLVKIDRDVLLHAFGKPVIRFVVDLTRAGKLRSTKVVVEGFDSDSTISLADIYNSGVRHVQGFRLGEPAPQPYQLSDGKAHEIRRLLVAD